MSPNEIIQQRRDRVLALRQQLVLEEAQLHGMEELYLAMTGENRGPKVHLTQPATPDGTTRGKPGGKRPGQLSLDWRRALETFYATDEVMTAETAAEAISQITKRDFKARDVRGRLAEYEQRHAFLVNEGNARYRVTDLAARRFNFKRSSKITEAAETRLNGAAASVPFLASREGGGADATIPN